MPAITFSNAQTIITAEKGTAMIKGEAWQKMAAKRNERR